MHLVVMSWNRLIYTRGDTELSIIKIGNIRQISLAMLIKRILTKKPSFYFYQFSVILDFICLNGHLGPFEVYII